MPNIVRFIAKIMQDSFGGLSPVKMFIIHIHGDQIFARKFCFQPCDHTWKRFWWRCNFQNQIEKKYRLNFDELFVSHF